MVVGCVYNQDMSLIEQLRERVEQTRLDLDAARQRSAEAKAIEDALASDLAGYQRALEAEERRGIGVVTATTMSTSAVASIPIAPAHDAATNKTAMVEEMIRARVDGLTAPEIYRELRRHDSNMHRNYVYSILGRLTNRGLIRDVGGRWVATPKNEGKLFRAS